MKSTKASRRWAQAKVRLNLWVTMGVMTFSRWGVEQSVAYRDSIPATREKFFASTDVSFWDPTEEQSRSRLSFF